MFDIDHFDELIRAAMDDVPALGGLCPEISRFGNGNVQLRYDTGHDHIDILAICRFRQGLHDRLYKLHGNRLGGLVGLTIETRVESVYEALVGAAALQLQRGDPLAICVTFAPLE